MNSLVVPIVFSFDRNLVFPACVCFSSLLSNAKETTFYDIYVMFPARDECDFTVFDRLKERYSNFRISIIRVDKLFENAFEIRGVTTPTYYRLAIPELFPQFDKVIYADVDMIFRQDLAEIYQTNLENNYIAATYDLGMNLIEGWKQYVQALPELVPGEYIQAGFLIMNCQLLRKEKVIEQFKLYAKRKFKFQDQDILNICCKGRIKILPWHCNMTDYAFSFINENPELLTEKYANSDVNEAKRIGNLHFNGHKPWKKFSVNFDIWWEYYRKSPFFDEKYYYQFYRERLNIFDQLSLWKRIKMVIRYFVYGRRDY